MALLFHSDDVDEFISLTEAVRLAEDALRNLAQQEGVNAPRKRLNLRREVSEASFVLTAIVSPDENCFGLRRMRVMAETEADTGGSQV